MPDGAGPTRSHVLRREPLMSQNSSKVTADHLRRNAYLYVRQSTLYQVANNTESARRQYDLRGRAVALGWPAEKVIVIDIDQGQSGASAADREGFQRLITDVSLGRAGIVLGLECSRLARKNADWHALLPLCAFNNTLICDEDGLYDPATINDRLLLGLKGTMSEAELYFIRARLQGGLLAKAARGELALRLPIGLVYDGASNVAADPDSGVRGAIGHLFNTFQATGSATATVKAFAAEALRFPARHLSGPRRPAVLGAAAPRPGAVHVAQPPLCRLLLRPAPAVEVGGIAGVVQHEQHPVVVQRHPVQLAGAARTGAGRGSAALRRRRPWQLRRPSRWPGRC